MNSALQQKYIDSVGGMAHTSAVDIIGALEAEKSRLLVALEDIAQIWPFTNEDAQDMKEIAEQAIKEAEGAI